MNGAFATGEIRMPSNSIKLLSASKGYLNYWFRQKNKEVENILTKESPFDGYTSGKLFLKVLKWLNFHEM